MTAADGSAAEFTDADAGGSRSVASADRIVVRLPENPTTGYRWRPEVDGSRLELLDDDFRAGSEQVGAGGEHTFVFRTLRPGPAALRLVRGRSWESAVAEDFQVQLHIED